MAVYGGFAGTEASRGQRNWWTHVAILSGDIDGNDTNTDGNFIAETPADIQDANAYHVVTGGFTNNTAVLDGFVITAGQANGTAPHDAGGGMYNQDASPRLTNLIFSGNAADGGGGMYNMNSHPVLADVTFSGNTSTDGGGMHITHYSTPTLIRATIRRPNQLPQPPPAGRLSEASARVAHRGTRAVSSRHSPQSRGSGSEVKRQGLNGVPSRP